MITAGAGGTLAAGHVEAKLVGVGPAQQFKWHTDVGQRGGGDCLTTCGERRSNAVDVKWLHVGDLNGSYKEDYEFQANANGAYRKDTIVTSTGCQLKAWVRNCCVGFLLLLLCLFLAYFLMILIPNPKPVKCIVPEIQLPVPVPVPVPITTVPPQRDLCLLADMPYATRDRQIHCCDTQGVCLPPPPPPPVTSTSIQFDCNADYILCNHCIALRWSLAKRRFCCRTTGRGCPTTTTQLFFDCSAGVALWKTGWSDTKKDWCCVRGGQSKVSCGWRQQ